jgi:hypothetical protein
MKKPTTPPCATGALSLELLADVDGGAEANPDARVTSSPSEEDLARIRRGLPDLPA